MQQKLLHQFFFFFNLFTAFCIFFGRRAKFFDRYTNLIWVMVVFIRWPNLVQLSQYLGWKLLNVCNILIRVMIILKMTYRTKSQTGHSMSSNLMEKIQLFQPAMLERKPMKIPNSKISHPKLEKVYFIWYGLYCLVVSLRNAIHLIF